MEKGVLQVPQGFSGPELTALRSSGRVAAAQGLLGRRKSVLFEEVPESCVRFGRVQKGWMGQAGKKAGQRHTEAGAVCCEGGVCRGTRRYSDCDGAWGWGCC